MLTVVHESDQVSVPEWVKDLSSFRRWAETDDFPEKGRICYLQGMVWIDMSKEQIFTHVLVETEITAVLRALTRAEQLGLLLGDGVLLSNLDADTSNKPDATFASNAALQDRVRLIEGVEEGHVELEGSPDLVLVSVFVGNDITEALATPRSLDPEQHALYLLCRRAWRLCRERQRRPEPPAPADRLQSPPLSPPTYWEVEVRRLPVCRTPVSPALEKKWRRALGQLDQIIAHCRRRDVPVAFVLIPDEFQVNPQVLAEALGRGGIDPRHTTGRIPPGKPDRNIGRTASSVQHMAARVATSSMPDSDRLPTRPITCSVIRSNTATGLGTLRRRARRNSRIMRHLRLVRLRRDGRSGCAAH